MISVFDNGAAAPCPSSFNLTKYVLAQGQQSPDKTALAILTATSSDNWSFAELTAAILGTGTGLLNAGLQPGDKLLMRMGNTVDFPIMYLAAIAVGIVPIPTSPQLTDPEVSKIIETITPAAIVVGEGVTCPDIPILTLFNDDMIGWYSLPPADYDLGDPNRLAYIVYTSGTSGVPRAVGHAHRAIWARRMMTNGWYALRGDDRVMHAGAFNWTFTLGTGLMDPWTAGATALIPSQNMTHADIPNLLKHHRATIFAAAPGVYRNLLKHVPFDVPELRHCLAAGEKLNAHIRDDWQNATGTFIYEAYGMSECSTFISSSPANPVTENALGYPQPGRQVAIMGESGPVEIGQPGVIAVHKTDPGLMLGYVGAKDATLEKFQGDWFLTGDLGQMGSDFQIEYLGRDDDMMNAGGYRVSPIEVEAALLAHPGITEVGVTDVEVKDDVRLISAFYTGPQALAEQELSAFSADRLARYKHPRFFVHVATMPRNANGKLVRKALRDSFKS